MAKEKKFKVTVGSDPEVFLSDAEGNPISAAGLIGASKGKPMKLSPVPLNDMRLNRSVTGRAFVETVLDMTGFLYAQDKLEKRQIGGVIEDNVMLELNPAPATTSYEFLLNHMQVMESIQATILDPRKLRFAEKLSSFNMPASQLHHKNAREFGCMPDNCVYLGGQRPPADAAQFGNMRVAGGHVHIGYDMKNSQLAPEDVTVLCDILMGLWSVGEDADTFRRTNYGQAGCFRVTAYGIEYRTLSNFWLWRMSHTVHIAEMGLLVGSLASGQLADAGRVMDFINATPLMLIKEAIDTGNKKLADSCIGQVGAAMMKTGMSKVSARLTRFNRAVYFGGAAEKLKMVA